MKTEKLRTLLHNRIKLNLEDLLEKFTNGGIISRISKTPSNEFKAITLQLRKDLIKYEHTFDYDYFDDTTAHSGEKE